MPQGVNRARLPAEDGEWAYGCLFCRTGKENRIAEEIEAEFSDVRAIFVKKLRRRRQGKDFLDEAVPLFPGYLFFRARADFDAQPLARKQDAFRLLHDSEGIWHLHGEDRQLAHSLFQQDGVVGLSKAYYEGDRIRIVDGLLKAYEGRIIRVNRRSQIAQVALGMGGQEVTVWLGFELIEWDQRWGQDRENQDRGN